MKSFIASALVFAGLAFSTSAVAAPSTFDRQFALDALLAMGYSVAPEEIGEMFRDNIFILVNSEVCNDLGSFFWDDSGTSCLMQVTAKGEIIGFQGDHSNSLYE